MKKTTISIILFLFCFLGIYSQQKNPLVNPANILNITSQLCDSDKYDQAIDSLLTISKGDTSYLQVLTELAYSYMGAKKYAEAVSTANKALALPSKSHHRLILIKGNAYDNWGYPDSALLTYNEALKKYPYSYLLYYNLGITYLNSKKYNQAITSFQQAIIRNPYHASSHLALGRALALMGQYVHAMLSIETYLIIEPNARRSNTNLKFINDFVNNALSSDYEKIDPVVNNKEFEETDQLIKAGIAMNSAYKQKIKFDAPIAKQTQLLFESLQYKPNTGDFWMEYYVPLFVAIKESNHFENFSYTILTSTPDKEVASQLNKRKKDLKEMYLLVSNKLLLFSKNQKITENGKERFVDFFLDENNYLVAVGNKTSDGQTRQGYWYFIHPNGEPKAEGLYNQEGKLDGKWLNFDKDGSLSLIENYLNGELHGEYTGFYPSGNKKYVATYTHKTVTGDVTYYYDCKAVSSIVHFDNNNRNGIGKAFYKNGVLSEEYSYVNDSLEGENKGYFPQGSLKWLYYYKNNKLTGKAINYYQNGKVLNEYSYSNSLKDGAYKSYHPNGTQYITGNFTADNKTGTWKEYNKKGMLTEISNYNEKGEMHGENKGWDNTENLYYTFIYNNGKVKEFTYFDKKGNSLVTTKVSDKTIPIKGYYATGDLLFDGYYSHGNMDGKWTYFFRNGKIKMIKNYKAGYLEGMYTTFFASGSKELECNYTHGLFNGYYKTYFSNLRENSEGWYTNGSQEGKWIFWNPDGSIKETMELLNDKLNGYCETYASEQKIQYSTNYKYGKVATLISYDNNSKEINNTTFDGTNDYCLYYFDKKIKAKASFDCNNMNSKYTFYTKDGKTESEYNYLEHLKEGKYICYYPNGVTKREGLYENDKATGLWKYYNEQGKLTKKGYFDNDEKDSIWTAYFDNGTIRSIGKFDQGQPADTSSFFDPSGELMYSMVYDNLGLISYQYNSPEGKKSKDIQFKDTGIIVTYYKNGKISSEQSYKYGSLEGKQTFYFSNGNKYKEFNLNNGEYNGKFVEYFENGKEKYIENFLLGLYYGSCTYFRMDGSKEHSEEYINDNENGSFIFYNLQGKVIKEQKYWNGILLN